ncbi:hypothetical protein ACLOJK_021572 [Asimina triloba]
MKTIERDCTSEPDVTDNLFRVSVETPMRAESSKAAALERTNPEAGFSEQWRIPAGRRRGEELLRSDEALAWGGEGLRKESRMVFVEERIRGFLLSTIVLTEKAQRRWTGEEEIRASKRSLGRREKMTKATVATGELSREAGDGGCTRAHQ